MPAVRTKRGLPRERIEASFRLAQLTLFLQWVRVGDFWMARLYHDNWSARSLYRKPGRRPRQRPAIRILRVDWKGGYRLALSLSTGRVLTRDYAAHVVPGKPLHDAAGVFAAARASDDGVAWPNGTRMPPETMLFPS